MTDDERYFFDLNGYLVLRDLIDADTLRRCHAAIDHFDDQIEVHERRFEGEGIRGTVAFDALFDEKRGARLELRVEGLPVEVVTIPVPGPISVRVESERLRADPRFRRVVSDGARKEVVARCIEEARALLAEVAEKHPRRALVKGALLEQVASSEELSDTVERVPLFDTLDEGLVSLETIRSWSSKDGGLRWARSVLVVPFGAPRVLHPQPAQLKALRARFKKLEDVTTSLEDELVRRRRFLAPPMPPKITGYVVARAYVETDEFHGEIGLGVEGLPAQGDVLGAVGLDLAHVGPVVGVEDG